MLLAAPVGAAEVDNLYQAKTIVTGQGVANRMVGFGRCLEDVLVKVSGDPRLIGDRRLAPLAAAAAGFVTAFDYHDRMSGIPVHDEQGTRDRPYDLTVDFERSRIDATLRGLGLAPWTGSRPRLVVFLQLRSGPQSFVLTRDGDHGRDQREALDGAAYKRGMPGMLPSASELGDLAPTADLTRLDAAAKILGGDVALAGQMTWVDRSLGWTANWRLASQGTTYRWRITGVSFDDAFRNAMAGAAQILSGHGRPN